MTEQSELERVLAALESGQIVVQPQDPLCEEAGRLAQQAGGVLLRNRFRVIVPSYLDARGAVQLPRSRRARALEVAEVKQPKPIKPIKAWAVAYDGDLIARREPIGAWVRHSRDINLCYEEYWVRVEIRPIPKKRRKARKAKR